MAASRFRMLKSIGVMSSAAVMSLTIGGALPAMSQQTAAPSVAAKPGEWRYLNADPQASRYAPLDQINAANFKDLKLAWRWTPNVPPAPPKLGGTAQGNGDPTLAIYKNESTPIMANGVLYTAVGGQRVVAAVDAATGKQLWMWNGIDEGGRDRKAPRRNAGRGVGYWTDGREERIFVVTTGFFLVALDARTGLPVPSFGANGVVDLMKELHVDFDHVTRIGNSSPPMVFKDTVIVPPALEEGFVPDSAQYPRLCDGVRCPHRQAEMGVPHRSEARRVRRRDLGGRLNQYTGNTGVWAPISVDPELGYAYLPVETPTNDYYGGHRLGSGLFGNSVVAVDARNRQAHLALPDHAPRHLELRPASAPTLVNMTVAGRPLKALVQLSKQGFAYVLDRVTGQPVWPIEERPVPPSDVPGERAWPTQPHPTKPAPYEYQGYVENEPDRLHAGTARRGDQGRQAVSLRPGVHPAFGDQARRHQRDLVQPRRHRRVAVAKRRLRSGNRAISTFRPKPAHPSRSLPMIRNRTCGFRADRSQIPLSRACRS